MAQAGTQNCKQQKQPHPWTAESFQQPSDSNDDNNSSPCKCEGKALNWRHTQSSTSPLPSHLVCPTGMHPLDFSLMGQVRQGETATSTWGAAGLITRKAIAKKKPKNLFSSFDSRSLLQSSEEKELPKGGVRTGKHLSRGLPKGIFTKHPPRAQHSWSSARVLCPLPSSHHLFRAHFWWARTWETFLGGHFKWGTVPTPVAGGQTCRRRVKSVCKCQVG